MHLGPTTHGDASGAALSGRCRRRDKGGGDGEEAGEEKEAEHPVWVAGSG